MSKSDSLLPVNYGITAKKDPGGVVHWNVDTQASQRIRRFIAWVSEVVMFPSKTKGLYAARLVAFDGVSPSSLEHIATQGATPYKAETHCFLEWEELDPPRTERRILSPLTVEAWQVCRASDVSSPIKLRNALEELSSVSLSYQALTNPANELELDALCWWYQCLPSPLFAHLARLQVLSALPRSSLARAEMKEAISANATNNEFAAEMAADVGFTAELVEVCHGPSEGRPDSVLIRQARDFLTGDVSGNDAMTKRQWAQNAFQLKERAQQRGLSTVLVLAWLAHLCEFGTPGKPNLAASSVKQYFLRAALPLWTMLTAFPLLEEGPESWNAEVLQAGYESLKSAESQGNKKTMASALNSFHACLMTWFEVPPLQGSLHEDIPVARVANQAIWAHERDLVLRWLDDVQDDRVQVAAKIILRVGWESPARTNELLRIRLGNIRIGRDALGPCMEVEIARKAILKRLKSEAAHRRLYIRDAQTIELVRFWKLQRQKEGAAPSSLMFGNPTSHSALYRPGIVIGLLNRLLKLATGESDVSIHSLRHGAISREIYEGLNRRPTVDINSFVATATHAGHAIAHTTLTSYFHVYEESIRVNLNFGLSECVPLSAQQVAAAIGLEPATLRQRCSRLGIPASQYLWLQIGYSASASTLPSVSEPYAWCVPKAPTILPKFQSEMTVLTAMQWLVSIEKGTSIEVLALVLGCEQSVLHRLIERLLRFGKLFFEKIHPRRNLKENIRIDSLPELLHACGFDLSSAKNPQFTSLKNWFEQEHPDQDLVLMQCAWRACRHGDYLALTDAGSSKALLGSLKSATVSAELLQIRMSSRDSDSSTTSMDMSHPISWFQDAFGRLPSTELVEPRSGRPAAYLQFNIQDESGRAANRTSFLKGFDAWMLAVTAYLIIREVHFD